MALITQGELEVYLSAAELQRLSDKANAAINAAMVANAIDMATSTVLKYAQGTPGYPWVTTPPEAKTCAIRLAAAEVMRGLWGFVALDRKEGAAMALAQLKELADGKTSWVEGQTPAAQNIGTVFSTNSVEAPRQGAPRRARRFFTNLL